MSTQNSNQQVETSLIVVRESGRDLSALDNLLDRTLRLLPDGPVVQELRSIGMEKLARPDGGCEQVVTGKDRGVLIPSGSLSLLLYQGSANMSAKSRGDARTREENRFSKTLLKVIKELRPSRVVVVEVSRLARRTDLFDNLLKALAEYSCIVQVGHREYDPRETSDRDDLKRHALSAESERNRTVDRVTSGVLSNALQGKWPMAENLLPLGYRLDEAGFPVVDVDLVDLVRAVIAVLGEPNVTSKEVVQKCGRLGVTSSGIKVRKGGRLRRSASLPTVADAKNPSEVVRRLRKALDVWTTGVYLYQRKCSSLYTHELLGVPVTIDPIKGRVFEVPIPMPAPPGGWSDLDSLRRASERGASARGRLSHSNQQSMFSHIPPWIEERNVHSMLRRSDLCVLKTRPALAHEHDGGDTDKIEGGTGKHQFSVQSTELLASMAVGIVDGLQTGVEGVVSDGAALEPTTNTAAAKNKLVYRHLAERVATIARQLDENLQILGRLDEGSRSLELQKKRTEELAIALEEAESELSIFGAVEERASSYLAESTELNLGFVARALAVMRTCTGLVSRQVAVHVSQVIIGFRLRRVSVGVAEWECWIRVPSSDGVAEVGPFRGRVRICSEHRGRGASKESSVVRSFMCEGGSLEQVAEELGILMPSALSRTKGSLSEMGFAPGTLTPILIGMPAEVRRALAFAVGLDSDLGYDSEWIDLLRRVYLVDSGQQWQRGWEMPLSGRQEVLDQIASNGGSMRMGRAGRSASLLNRWARDEGVPATHAVLRPTRRTSGAILTPRGCPHCRSDLTHIVHVPELAFGFARATCLACTNCRRAEARESAVLPDCYFQLPESGQSE